MIRDVGASARPVPAPRRDAAPAEEFRLPAPGEGERPDADRGAVRGPAGPPDLAAEATSAQVTLGPAVVQAEGRRPAPEVATRESAGEAAPSGREPQAQRRARATEDRGGAPVVRERAQEQGRTPQEPGRRGMEDGSAAGHDVDGTDGEAEVAGEAEQRALAARLAQADRVAQTLRVAHRPAEVTPPALASALATAVGRVLREVDLATAPETSLPQDALAVLVARGEASAHLAAPRVASTMPTPTHAAHDAAMQMWELPGEPGMVVRLGEAQLEVRLLLEGQRLQVRLRADDPAAQARLQEALPELKRALEKLPEVAAHGGHVDVRDESPGRERRQDQPPEPEDDDTMAEALEGAMAQRH